MIIEQLQPVKDENEAGDMLAGWCEIPGFMVGYLTGSDQKMSLVGLFTCQDGRPGKGQKEISKLVFSADKKSLVAI